MEILEHFLQKKIQAVSKSIWGFKGSKIVKTKHLLKWLTYKRMIMPFFILSQGELDILILSSRAHWAASIF